MKEFSIIFSFGKPVWKLIIDSQKGQFRIVFAYFSLIFVDFDIDSHLARKEQ